MVTIRWTDTAEDSYLAILQSHYEHSTETALALDSQMEHLLDTLKQFRFRCPALPNFPGLRRCLVVPHIGLVYLVLEEELIVVSVFDTRTDHPFQ